jgi:hypothetical protein
MSGHIRRRGERSWELKFDLGRDPVTGKRRSQAEIELARLVAQNAAGEGVDPSKATVAEFAERWDRDWASLSVSPKTLERYRQIIRLNVVPHVGSMPIQKLRPVHLVECYCAPAAAKGVHWRQLRLLCPPRCIVCSVMPRPGALLRRTWGQSSARRRHRKARSPSSTRIRSVQRCATSRAAHCDQSCPSSWGLAPAAVRR